MIEGYTDSTGSNDYNQKLSVRRADAVRTALIDMGISSDRISTRGYGEEFPVASNKTAAGRQQNRRVEIILSDENRQHCATLTVCGRLRQNMGYKVSPKRLFFVIL